MEFNDVWLAVVNLAVNSARTITDDQKALEVKVLYKQWPKQIGKRLEVGEYVQHENKLYRVLQAHVAQDTWAPGNGTESLFVVIDKDHKGTLDDPIPYTTNMELFIDKYYSEDGVLYICTRDSGNPLYHKLSELVGLYVSVVEEVIITPPVGSKDDPIVYTGDTLLVKNLYYIQNDILYLCVLNASAPLYCDLSSLVGLYVQVANTGETSTPEEPTPEEPTPEEPTPEEPIPEEGTRENPIAYSTGMEIFNGKYYIQNGVVYLCNRDSGAPLYHDLSALVGLYVKEVK